MGPVDPQHQSHGRSARTSGLARSDLPHLPVSPSLCRTRFPGTGNRRRPSTRVDFPSDVTHVSPGPDIPSRRSVVLVSSRTAPEDGPVLFVRVLNKCVQGPYTTQTECILNTKYGESEGLSTSDVFKSLLVKHSYLYLLKLVGSNHPLSVNGLRSCNY